MTLTYEDFDTEQAAKDLYEEMKHSYETKDDLYLMQSIFRDDISRPGEWRAKEGEHILDIIPFKAGKIMTKSRLQNKKEGNIVYKMELYVHPRVGPIRTDMICLAQTFGMSCPICELRSMLFDKEKLSDREQKILDSNRPIRRVAYNIWCHDSKEETKKGVQLWIIAHFFFENNVAEIAKLPKEGGFLSWTHPRDGKSVMFKRKGMGPTNTSYLGHKFVDRDGPIPLEILKQSVSIDEVVTIPDYKQVFETFFQIPYSNQPVTVSLLSGMPSEPEAETDTDDYGEAATETTEEIESTEEKPALSIPGDDNKEEVAKESMKDNECPHGHTFGVDLEQTADCGNCTKWDACADESDRLTKVKKKGKKKE